MRCSKAERSHAETLDGRPYYDEVRASLLRELDYTAEADQLRAYAEAASAFSELAVPQVIPERSSRKVLTLTRLRGPSLLQSMEQPGTAEERFRVARLLIFAIWGPFYQARLIHADPHPGNFLVLPDGRLGVLDFGATKRLSPQFAEVYRGFLDSLAAGSGRPQVGPSLKKAGFRFLGDEQEGFKFCEKMADIVERPSMQDEYDFGSDPMVQNARRLFQGQPGTAIKIKPPPEAVLFYRAAAGLAQDLRLLKAAGRFKPILSEIRARGRLPSW